jgi:hypothetical protein
VGPAFESRAAQDDLHFDKEEGLPASGSPFLFRITGAARPLT